MTLLEVEYRRTDVSGGVRTPPLIQLMYTYVCTHGHRTCHDPLHRAVGRESTHGITRTQTEQGAGGSAESAAEERRSVGGRLRGAGGKLML